MKDLGFNVKGSDQQSGKNIERLKKNKISVKIRHKQKKLKSAKKVIISSAKKKNKPE